MGAELSTRQCWFERCCLTDPENPLTHTIGYVLRGLLEGYRASGDAEILSASRLTADSVMKCVRDDGYLAGPFDADWNPTVSWVCLTGSAQLAACFLLLYEFTSEVRYAEAGTKLNNFVGRTVQTEGHDDIVGAVKGSYPVWGDYGYLEYLNWAPKFLVDSLLFQMDLNDQIAT
jgi:hypothetical protein